MATLTYTQNMQAKPQSAGGITLMSTKDCRKGSGPELLIQRWELLRSWIQHLIPEMPLWEAGRGKFRPGDEDCRRQGKRPQQTPLAGRPVFLFFSKDLRSHWRWPRRRSTIAGEASSQSMSLPKKYKSGSRNVFHRRHVLTAAHCMDEVDLKEIPDLLSVVLGLHDLRGVWDLSEQSYSIYISYSSYSSQNEKAQRVEIAKVHLPPKFSWETLKKDGINDAALLELKKDVEMSPKVRLKTCISMSKGRGCVPASWTPRNIAKALFKCWGTSIAVFVCCESEKLLLIDLRIIEVHHNVKSSSRSFKN